MQTRGSAFLLGARAAAGTPSRGHEDLSANQNPLAFFRRTMRQHPRLDREHELCLIHRAQDDGDKVARSKVALHNLGVVYAVARRHLWSKVDLLDLIQEGVPGLVIAVDKYDFDRGASFQTYAAHWVRGTMRRAAVDTANLIRIPAPVHELAWRIRRLMRDEGWDWTATDSQIAVTLEEHPQRVRAAREVTRFTSTSLDAPIYVDEATTLEDTLPSNGLPPDLVSLAKSEIASIRQRLYLLRCAIRSNDRMSEKQKSMFVLFYDLDGNLERRTLDAIGKEFGMTREGVRINLVRCWKHLPRRLLSLNQDSILTEVDRLLEMEELIATV